MNASYSAIADKVLLQPWFLPKRVAFAIHGMVPRDFWNKMRHFYEDYGCMICGCTDETKYHSNGMCRLCGSKIRNQLAASVRRRSRANQGSRLDFVLLRQEKLAKELLTRFVPPRRAPRRRKINLPGRNNPVYEALCARLE
jgi:hypothetical protein